MARGDQDHGCVAMPVAAMLASAAHQPVDLALGEIPSLDCQVYDGWCAHFYCTVAVVRTPQWWGQACGETAAGASKCASQGDFSDSNFHPALIPGNLA